MLRPYYENEHGVLYHGDCLDVMDALSRRGFVADMVLCDPPYGTTACAWDSVVPFDKMWSAIWGVAKGPVVLTSAQPFTTALIGSAIGSFRYNWVWVKPQGVDPFMAKKRPLNNIEDISVFSRSPVPYNPQFSGGTPYKIVRDKKPRGHELTGQTMRQTETVNDGFRWPKRTLEFGRETGLHPTQKPVALFAYLIQTYTNPGEVVLDFCAGSGTTAVAAQSTGRRWVCIEKEQKYCDLLVSRLEGLKCESTLPSHTTTKARKSARRDSTQSTLPLAV